MTKIANTNLYYLNETYNWNDSKYIAVFADNGSGWKEERLHQGILLINIHQTMILIVIAHIY